MWTGEIPMTCDQTQLQQTMEYRKLGQTDMMLSQLALGGAALGSVYGDVQLEQAISCVHEAIDLGINYIDTAPYYGNSEAVLGEALKGVPRESYYIATKVGRYHRDVVHEFDFSAQNTIHSVDESLQKLGIDYVDIIQVHDIEFCSNVDIILNETLPALKKIRDSGKARYIGITGYPLEIFRTILERSNVKIDTVLTYCRQTLNDKSLQEYLPYFQEQGVGVICASPFSMGLLSGHPPPSWHPASHQIQDICAQAAKYCQSEGTDIAKLALHFSLQDDRISTTLFGTARSEELHKNLKTLQDGLTKKEQDVLEYILSQYFKPHGNLHWEGIYLDKYWKNYREQAASVQGTK